jgi:putative DNA primase/helicase
MPPVLYRLPEVAAAIEAGQTIYVCEGEKDADRLTQLGVTATTNIEGAAKPEQRAKWCHAYTEQLAGATRVVLLPDNDDPGRAHMHAVASALHGKVAEVRTLVLPDLPVKGDVSDWLDAGHGIEG